MLHHLTARTNSLLANAASPGRSQLLKLLTPVKLTVGDVLYEARERIRYVYFPLDCMVSLLMPQNRHLPLEVAMVGSEGMMGVPLALGMRTSFVQAVVQGSGSALRMSAQGFSDELSRQHALRHQVGAYIHALIVQLTRSAACNAFHPLEARCARWLLMARDRMQADELELTHESLAQMLGVRRVGVTVAAGNLQRAGAIAYSRGHIRILDPKKLGAAACECYRATTSIKEII